MANTHSLDLEKNSSQYVSITDALQTALDFTVGDFTLELWIKVESQPGSGVIYSLVSKYGTVNRNGYSFEYYNNGGTPQIRMLLSSNGNNEEIRAVNQTLTNGVWYHIAASTKASTNTTTFFVNGSSIGSASSSISGLFNGDLPFNIGTRSDGSNIDGKIDDVRAWAIDRQAADILANYRKEIIGNESNLKGYWKFNNSYNDATANGNNLTSSGSPVFSSDVPFGQGGAFLLNFI